MQAATGSIFRKGGGAVKQDFLFTMTTTAV